jgi:hypothetical protein
MTGSTIQPPFHAVTVKAVDGKLREIVTDAEVFTARSISKSFNIIQKSEMVKAIWDTGATGTVISSGLVSRLGLVPTGKTVAADVNKSYETNTYVVDIGLPNGLLIFDVQVTEVPNLGHYDLLIGMDLITMGDMAITNGHGNTWFSFRFPPDPVKIDYVERHNDIMKKLARRGRNKSKSKVKHR